MSNSAASPRGWSTCRVCNYKRKGYVKEVEDDYLERCPSCGAYDWSPEPIKVKS